MTKASVSRARTGARALALLVPLLAALGLSGACVESKRSLGEDCLKDSDCQSGICSQLRCAAAPPLTTSQPTGDAAPELEGGSDAATDAAPGVDATPDMSVPEASNEDSPSDAPGDAATGGG